MRWNRNNMKMNIQIVIQVHAIEISCNKKSLFIYLLY